MSRIIKGNHVMVTQPKVIKIDEIRERQTNFERHNNKTAVANGNVQQDEIKEIKEESEQIIRETEEMVVELLGKAREEARSLIENAREEADMVLNNAKKEALQLQQESLEQGYREGMEQAQAEMKEAREEAEQESERIIADAHRTRVQMIKSSEADMLRLVLAVSKKVIATEITINPDVVVNVIAEAISYLDNIDHISVHVNSEEVLKILDAVNVGLITDSEGKAIDLEVIDDKKISVGGCIVEHEEGAVDARVETRMDRLGQALLGVNSDE